MLRCTLQADTRGETQQAAQQRSIHHTTAQQLRLLSMTEMSRVVLGTNVPQPAATTFPTTSALVTHTIVPPLRTARVTILAAVTCKRPFVPRTVLTAITILSYTRSTPTTMLSSTFNSHLLAALLFLGAPFQVIAGGTNVHVRYGVANVDRPSMSSTSYPGEELQFSDDFDELNFEVWKHDLTMGGGGNWEFEYYSQSNGTQY